MKRPGLIFILTFLLTGTLQIRLYHDNRKGYSYNITAPSVDEVIESDQKIRRYLNSLVPKKKAVPAPSTAVPKAAPAKK
jgi:hypothetical protein